MMLHCNTLYFRFLSYTSGWSLFQNGVLGHNSVTPLLSDIMGKFLRK